MSTTFAKMYSDLFYILYRYPVNIECRGKSIAYECTNVRLPIDCSKGISIFSHKDSRVFPMRFTLGELLWIMSRSNKLADIAPFNKGMTNFSDDGEKLYGAYGWRLADQIFKAIEKMKSDKHTRQAYCAIYDNTDIFATTKDLPCNTSLQFMIRDNKLTLTVNSRSSDFMTGLPIDAFHWQSILCMVRNDLLILYPDLYVDKVIYNITSLHVYKTDEPLLVHHVSSMFRKDYEHLLEERQCYTHIVDELYTGYKNDILIEEMAHILGFSDIKNIDKILELQTMFKSHNNKLAAR